MDLDGDGRRDVITGSWPGELYWFRGEDGGTYAAARQLKGPDGKPLNLGNASTVFAMDWEGDGDLDLLVGDIDGAVHLVLNGSGGKALEFGSASRVRVGTKSLTVDGDSAPILADWDGDGRSDLIVGAGGGSVIWCRDLAKEGAPLFGRSSVLVAPSTMWNAERGAKAPTPWGVRTKPCVADWDGDGKLDLLVGDFGNEEVLPDALTPAQEKRRDELHALQNKLNEERVERYRKAALVAAGELGLKVVEGEAQPPTDRAQQERFHIRIAQLVDTEEPGWNAAQMQRMQDVWRELAPLQAENRPHGYVWFFRRR